MARPPPQKGLHGEWVTHFAQSSSFLSEPKLAVTERLLLVFAGGGLEGLGARVSWSPSAPKLAVTERLLLLSAGGGLEGLGISAPGGASRSSRVIPPSEIGGGGESLLPASSGSSIEARSIVGIIRSRRVSLVCDGFLTGAAWGCWASKVCSLLEERLELVEAGRLALLVLGFGGGDEGLEIPPVGLVEEGGEGVVSLLCGPAG